MNKKGFYAIFGAMLFLTALLFSSCADVMKPVKLTSIENVTLLGINNKKIDLKLDVKVKNPNSFSFYLYPDSGLSVSLNSLDIGKAKLKHKVKIHSDTEETDSFEVETDLSNLSLAALPELFSLVQSGTANVSIKGTIKCGNWFYSEHIPVRLSKKIDLQQK